MKKPFDWEKVHPNIICRTDKIEALRIFNKLNQDLKNAVGKLKESEGDFVERLCQGAKFSWADIGVAGIVKGVFWLSGGSYAYNAICTDAETEVSGTCRVSSGFFSNLAFFKITGDKNTDGMIILGGGILILFIFFSRLGGKK